jgi:hypothetical protein
MQQRLNALSRWLCGCVCTSSTHTHLTSLSVALCVRHTEKDIGIFGTCRHVLGCLVTTVSQNYITFKFKGLRPTKMHLKNEYDTFLRNVGNQFTQWHSVKIPGKRCSIASLWETQTSKFTIICSRLMRGIFLRCFWIYPVKRMLEEN